MAVPAIVRRGRRVGQADVLLHPVRGRLNRVLAESGDAMTLAQLASRLSLTNSTLLWHLLKLTSAGLAKAVAGPPTRYVSVKGKEQVLAEAVQAMDSVPARELIDHLRSHPGRHLGEAAAAMGAPRSRYWRVVPQLERAGLLRVVLRGRQRLLHATPLAEQARRSLSGRKWRLVKARRTRRPGAPK